MFHALRRPEVLFVTLAAAGILAITMGARQSLGLFVSPLNTATGLGIASISLALAAAAAVLNLPIREAPVVRAAAPA
jgi:hypothetical protein